jgi:hypothetical protein
MRARKGRSLPSVATDGFLRSDVRVVDRALIPGDFEGARFSQMTQAVRALSTSDFNW